MNQAGDAASGRAADATGDRAGLVMPYRRWRRWVRALRARAARRRTVAAGGDPSDRVYYAYGFVLVAAMYGPMLWTVLAQAGVPLAGTAGLAVAGGVAFGAGCVLAVVAARLGGPLWVSPPEAVYALGGAFGVPAVLWRRGVAVGVGLGVIAAVGASALASGAGADPLRAALLAAVGAQLVLAVGIAAQRGRAGFDVDAAAAAYRRTVGTGVGLAAGDGSGLRDVLGPARLTGRRRTFPGVLLSRAPLAARDLLGISRRPWTLAGSLAVGIVGAGLVALGTADVPGAALAVVGGAMVLYGATAAWTGGLRDAAAQPVPGGLLPWSVSRLVGGHLVVPLALACVVALAGPGAVLLWTDAPVDAAGVGVTAVLVLLAVAVRCWVAGATTVPRELFTPMAGPGGDMSMLTVAAWYVRGWLVVALTAWTAQRWGVVVAVLAVGLGVLLVRSAMRRMERL